VGPAEIAQLVAPADRIDRAKDFFVPFASALTLAVAQVPRGPAVVRAAPPAFALGYVRCDAQVRGFQMKSCVS